MKYDSTNQKIQMVRFNAPTTLLKMYLKTASNSAVHEAIYLENGILIDVFLPMTEGFV
jgi:hypothetical protein